MSSSSQISSLSAFSQGGQTHGSHRLTVWAMWRMVQHYLSIAWNATCSGHGDRCRGAMPLWACQNFQCHCSHISIYSTQVSQEFQLVHNSEHARIWTSASWSCLDSFCIWNAGS